MLNAAKNKTGAAPITNVEQSGYYKVLGKRERPKQPVILKAKFFIRRAEKIGREGGWACPGSMKLHGGRFIKC